MEDRMLDYVTIAPQDTEKLLAAGNPAAVMVYLYVRATGDYALRNAAAELRLGEQELSWAETLLKRLGLLEVRANPTKYEPGRAPVFTAEDVTKTLQQDNDFSLLQGEVSRRMGRPLNEEELKTLLSIKQYLSLSAEVIVMALTYCLQRNEYSNKSRGTERTVSVRALEKECYIWANKGISTVEQASAYIGSQLSMQEPESQVKRVLHIDRALVSGEREYIDAWLRMGFPADSIASAYEKTVLATGKLAWPYMNKILLNWHEKGLHTPAEIAGEKTAARRQTTAQESFVPGEAELASVSSLQKFRDSLKKE